MKLKLGFVLGYSGSMIPILIKILNNLRKSYFLEYTIITPYKYSEDDLKSLMESNVVLIYSSKLPDDVEDILRKLSREAKVIAIDGEHISLSSVDQSLVSRAAEFMKIGGEENLKSLILLMLKLAGVKEIEVPKPTKILWHGIYHPKYGVFNDVKKYLKVYPYANRPLIGILFYRSDWLYNRTVIIDKLIEELEALDLGVVPVFTYGFRDDRLGSPSHEDTIRKFFLIDNKPIIDVLVKLTSFFLLDHGKSTKWAGEGYRIVHGIELLRKLNVPIIQCLITYRKSPEEWLKDKHGVDCMTIVYRIAMPEVDGAIEPIVVAGVEIGSYGDKKIISIDKHILYLARRIKKWVNLRRKSPSERKIAIILINPPCKGLEANVAIGLGLDVPESIVRLLKYLKENGYNIGNNIPKNGEELIRMILEKRAISEFRWTSIEEIVARGGALDFVDEETYVQWFNELPNNVRERMIKEWGDPRDVLYGKVNRVLIGMIYNNKFVIPGLRFGNIVIIPQPKRGCVGTRCDGRVCKILHDPTIPPPHQWLAVYRWLTRVFKADVIIHFGTHGYLEFLPGKSVGLSWMCWPEISIDDVPHLYVYVVSNPMEGVIAKRRSYATLIDHLYPPMKLADVLDDIESLLTQYSHAKTIGDYNRAMVVYKQLVDRSKNLNIPLPKGVNNPDETIEAIHKYIHVIRNTQINMGLHILGSPPKEPRKLAEYIATICAFDSHRVPSLRRVVAKYLGIDYDELRKKPMEINRVFGTRNSEVLDILYRISVNVLEKLIKLKLIHDKDIISILNNEVKMIKVQIKNVAQNTYHNESIVEEVVKAFKYALSIVDLIRKCKYEMNNLVNGTKGFFIEPGASGSLTRGKIEVLPTGRNFYLIDPRTLPTPAAWKIGKETAEKIIKYYLEKHGRYPESIGQVLWSIDAYKADGEQLAQILYLIGVEPIWDDSGIVKDLRIIPLKELGRPRIDIVVRISSIVRDTLPNYIEIIDKAIARVISLDEPLEMNYVKKHYIENIKKLMSMGIDSERAKKLARYRVFGAPPGAYGAGVNLAIEASAWSNNEDLAKIWIQWSGYAYGIDAYGEPAHESLIVSLENIDIVNRNHVSDEHDIFNCCCYFAYHGGFYNAAKALSKRNDIEIITVDTRDISLTDVRSMDLEAERITRAKLLNKLWIEEMKKHGYRGANEFQRKILHLYGWAAISRVVKDWIFNEIAKTYILNEEMKKWFMEHNIWALEEITRRLVEAAIRGIWKAPRELLEELRKVYSEIEGVLEDDITLPADIQGGSIDIITPNQVSSWSKSLEKIDVLWSKIRRYRK